MNLVITKFTNKFIPIVQRFLPCLRFAADETMLQPNINRKVLTPNRQGQPILPGLIELSHITATCCCSVLGEKKPLFIIVPNRIE